MDPADVVQDILEHHGVKGMKWGVRKNYATSAPTSTKGPKGLDQFPKSQSVGMADIARKMEKAYGMKTHEFVPFTEKEDRSGMLAYVQANNRGSGNIIHVTRNENYHPMLKQCNDMGWFVKAEDKNLVQANLTHESAHAMFHARDLSGHGVFGRVTADQPIGPMRKRAWDKAVEAGLANGEIQKGFFKASPEYQIAKKLSKYAHSSPWLEEHEAEMFTAYHWDPNPPKFVDAFMNDIHSSMGKKVQPFSGRKINAS